jgi:TonB family protein
MTHLGPSLRRKRRAAPRWRRAALALLVSLALNALVLKQVHVDWTGIQMKPGEARPVVLAPLSASQWAANRGVPPPGAPMPILPPVVPAPPPEKAQAPGQVVDVAPAKDNRPPKDSRFVSDRDNTVEKETRSRDARAGYENTLARPTQNKVPPAPQPERRAAAAERGAEGAQAGEARRPGAPGRPGQRARAQASQERLALNVDPQGGQRPRQERRPKAGTDPLRPEGAEGGGGESGFRPPKAGPVLSPSAAFYDRLSGGPAPDHLEGVDVGEGTFLNTREWKYASYFNRIKQAVATAWDPNSVLRLRDPTGERFAYKDRTTILAVTLNDQGSLTDVRVQRTSGVDFLDHTALDAFQKAQPFVNPPRGLADSHGEIKFTFGFYLEVGSPGLRLFRGPALP